MGDGRAQSAEEAIHHSALRALPTALYPHERGDPLNPSMSDVIRAVCPHDCPDTCSMLVTVENGRATRIAGDPEHPITQGFLCTKVAKYLERTSHPDRLLFPQMRAGAKGDGTFRRASWDEALSLIAE